MRTTWNIVILALVITVLPHSVGGNTHVRIHIHPHRAKTRHASSSSSKGGDEMTKANETVTVPPSQANDTSKKDTTNLWQPTQAFLYDRDELFCPRGWSNVQVKDVDGVYCVQGSSRCNGTTSGQCPQATEGLSYGSHCQLQEENGLYACVAHSHDCEDKEEIETTVEGISGVFCIKGPACKTKLGVCPGPQVGLPWGSSCKLVKDGVYGCQANPISFGQEKDEDKEEQESATPKEQESGSTPKIKCKGSPMSVEGVPGVFCVEGQACVADVADGACPGPQQGLKYGSSCDTVESGVYGCVANTKPPKEEEEEEEDEELCGKDERHVTVEGVEGFFCVPGRVCETKSKGACPSPQEGLEYGAYCATLASGEFGCKPILALEDGDESSTEEEEGSEDTIVVDVNVCDGEDERPITVQGVDDWFCVSGQACEDDHHGACPGPQKGLEWGSSCTLNKKEGVYGCQPNTAEEEEEVRTPAPETDDSTEEDEESEEEEVHTPTPETDDSPEEEEESEEEETIVIDVEVCDGEDESPISVQGVKGYFCVTGQACVADRNGQCPGPQEGLTYGAYCGTVETGVLGCLPITAPGSSTPEEDSYESSSVSGSTIGSGDGDAGDSGSNESGDVDSSSTSGSMEIESSSSSISGSVGDQNEDYSSSASGSVGDQVPEDSASGSDADQSSSASGSVGIESSSASGSVGDYTSSSSGGVEIESSSASGSVGDQGPSVTGDESSSARGSVGDWDQSVDYSTSASGSVEIESSSASGSVGEYSSNASGSVGDQSKDQSSSASGNVEMESSSTSGSVDNVNQNTSTETFQTSDTNFYF